MLDNGNLRRAFQAAAHVTELGLLTAGGLWLGRFLDDRYHTGPWLFLLLTLFGFVGGLARLFGWIQRHLEDDDQHPDDTA